MNTAAAPLHVSPLATPDAQVAPLSGLFETLNAFPLLANFETQTPQKPFAVDIVAESPAPVTSASGLSLGAHRTYSEVSRTDIVIVPLMMVQDADWISGRYPALVDWLREMHEAGATLCSACTGVLLLAETGLLDGGEATIHWAFAPTFRRNFPGVRLRTEEVLLTGGHRNQFVMTGGVMSWHDLALYLIAHHVGSAAAHAMARLMMLEWHGEGQAPYVGLAARRNHGDALVLQLQDGLGRQFTRARPVEEMAARAGLSRRSLERRFARATGLSPNGYVQALRIEEAKRRLEATGRSIDQISREVGYENTAFFRRLFKRWTRLTPGAYRRRFRVLPSGWPPGDRSEQ